MVDVIQEHFEELDFLWEQRERVIFARDWNLRELAALEERADAHLDGLRIGDEHAVNIARPGLVSDESGAATAAAFTLLRMDNAALAGEVARAFEESGRDAQAGIRIALRHSDVGRVTHAVERLAASGDALTRAAATDVLAFHRLPRPRGLEDLLRHSDRAIRRLAYAALGRFGGPMEKDDLETAVNDDDGPLRGIALDAAARLGFRDLSAICRDAALGTTNATPDALAFLGVIGDPESIDILTARVQDVAMAAAALAGLGCMGKVSAIPLIIEAMAEPTRTKAAGAAFVRITGATEISSKRPLPPAPGLDEDERDLRDQLFPNDPDRAASYWKKYRDRFAPEGRWQAGVDVSREPLGRAFNMLPLQIRRDVYRAERLRNPAKTPDLELEMRASWQLRRPQEGAWERTITKKD
jgi:uncharacterized protein (TIGR02270 family)